MSLNEYIKNNRLENGIFVKPIVCKDGFTISVQASHGHYCSPQIDNAEFYTSVECGYPSDVPEFIIDYAEDHECPTDTVYGRVPVTLVEQLLESHGGIV